MAKHPEIAPCYQKEPNFFASDENWSKGLAWYESLWDYQPNKHKIALEGSRYAKQIDEYYKRFPAKNIRLVNFEDLKSNLSNLLTEICKFLEIDPTYDFQINSKIYNPTKGKFIDGSLWHLISPLTKTLPTKVQQSIRRSLGQQVRDNVRLTQKQRDFVLRELREDLLKLQFEYGVDVSRWGIEL